MPEKEILQHMSMTDKTMWSVIILFMLGSMARSLISDEPFCLRKFLGEMIFSTIGGIILYSFGLLQHMSIPELICFGGLGSLGGIRMLEWMFKIAKQVKGA